jgi:hypothetical protein
LGFYSWSYSALIFQSLNVSIFDVAFYPVPVKVHGDLLFLGPDTAILLYIFLFGPAIVFLLVHYPFHSLSRHLLFGLRCDIL